VIILIDVDMVENLFLLVMIGLKKFYILCM